MLQRLQGCRVVEGFLQITLIDNQNSSAYDNFTFPNLTEITGYLLLYRVNGLRSIGQLFPNLAVIGGSKLIKDFALIIFELMDLEVRRSIDCDIRSSHLDQTGK
jgi:insulin receptor